MKTTNTASDINTLSENAEAVNSRLINIRNLLRDAKTVLPINVLATLLTEDQIFEQGTSARFEASGWKVWYSDVEPYKKETLSHNSKAFNKQAGRSILMETIGPDAATVFISIEQKQLDADTPGDVRITHLTVNGVDFIEGDKFAAGGQQVMPALIQMLYKVFNSFSGKITEKKQDLLSARIHPVTAVQEVAAEKALETMLQMQGATE